MLADDHPDRIKSPLTTTAWWPMLGWIPSHAGPDLGLPELVDRRLDLGAPQAPATGDDAGGFCSGRRSSTTLRTCSHRRDRQRHRLRSQGAIHPGDLPPVSGGACPPTGNGSARDGPGWSKLGPDPRGR